MNTAKILDKSNMGLELCHKVLGANTKKLKKWVIILSIILVLVVVCAILSSMIGVYFYFTKKKDKFESISKYDEENNKYINS